MDKIDKIDKIEPNISVSYKDDLNGLDFIPKDIVIKLPSTIVKAPLIKHKPAKNESIELF